MKILRKEEIKRRKEKPHWRHKDGYNICHEHQKKNTDVIESSDKGFQHHFHLTFKSTAEWTQQHKTKPAIKIIDAGKTIARAKPKYKWIEHLLVSPVDDGRHRLLWLVIAPYLVNVKNLSLEASNFRIWW